MAKKKLWRVLSAKGYAYSTWITLDEALTLARHLADKYGLEFDLERKHGIATDAEREQLERFELRNV